jgi:hypothetical protein
MFSAFSTYVQVQVLPESRFWLRISIEFHLKKWDKKSPVTVVVTGFFAPISKSVRIVGINSLNEYKLLLSSRALQIEVIVSLQIFALHHMFFI